jgi:Sec-independent protein translocase protein TatA
MELIFILIIALIVLGPEDMAKAGKTLGRTMRKVAMSPTWRAVQQTSRELRALPYRLMREAGLDEIEQELNFVKDTQKELRREVDDIRRIRSPLKATAEELKNEGRTIQGDFGAWTQPPAEAESRPSGEAEAAPSDDSEPASE